MAKLFPLQHPQNCNTTTTEECLFFGTVAGGVFLVGLDSRMSDPSARDISHDERMRRDARQRDKYGWDPEEMWGRKTAQELASWEEAKEKTKS